MYLIEQAIKATKLRVSLQVVSDGEQAIGFFDRTIRDSGAPAPDLVILDINLPRKQGGDVLKHMRRIPRCAKARVIAVSTSDSANDRQEMMELGARAYFRKPSEYAEFMKLGELVQSIMERR